MTTIDTTHGTTNLNVQEAVCARRGFDPEMWFPSPSEHVPLHNAKFVCGICPLKEACARMAADNKFDGVWGGTFFKNGRAVN